MLVPWVILGSIVILSTVLRLGGNLSHVKKEDGWMDEKDGGKANSEATPNYYKDIK